MLKQNSTVHMFLLTETSAFRLERCQSFSHYICLTAFSQDNLGELAPER